MFRNRLYAQGFTLLAMLAGSMYYEKDRTRRKEFEKVIAERKAKEKNEAWIRELEIRDREDKEWRVRMGKVTAAQAAAAEKEDVTEKEVGQEKSGGASVALKELVLKDKKAEHDGGERKEKRRASGSDDGGGIIPAVKKGLVGTENKEKDSLDDAAEAAKNQLASPRR